MLYGWKTQYSEIREEFGYDEKLDKSAAVYLDRLILTPYPVQKLTKMIREHVVFVIGAGPSLSSSIRYLKKFKDTVKIVADGAVTPLVKNNIPIDIVVTDLDGNISLLKKISNDKIVFVVHGHGDNISKLSLVKHFVNCIGTTQTKEYGNVHNFGGFTDGDRAVFLASHFGAKKIILFGMDFGNKIGRYSYTNRNNREIKLKKLQKGEQLLKWLASKSKSAILTTSKPIEGIEKISFNQLNDIVFS